MNRKARRDRRPQAVSEYKESGLPWLGQGLAACIAQREPGRRGFPPQNLWRMWQFFVIRRDFPILSPLVRVLRWSSHLDFISRSNRPEEREFYLRLSATEQDG
ncbi:MAG: DUF1016 N-terminal domain-containing protein [Burkholderiales bacterium]